MGWTASTDLGGSGVTAYLIERCAGAGCATFALVATVTGTPPVTTFADTGLTASTSYSYRARARDAAGNVSTAYSNVSTAVTPTAADTTPPTAPTNLTATPSAGQMSLSWGPSSDLGGSGVAAYLIERCAGAGCTSFALIATLTGTPPVTNYTDTGLTANTAYSYRVKAQDVAGNVGGYSNTTGSAVVPDCD